MSVVSSELNDSESENFDGSGSEAYLEVEIDGQDDSEDTTAEIYVGATAANPEKQFEERLSEQEGCINGKNVTYHTHFQILSSNSKLNYVYTLLHDKNIDSLLEYIINMHWAKQTWFLNFRQCLNNNSLLLCCSNLRQTHRLIQ